MPPDCFERGTGTKAGDVDVVQQINDLISQQTAVRTVHYPAGILNQFLQKCGNCRKVSGEAGAGAIMHCRDIPAQSTLDQEILHLQPYRLASAFTLLFSFVGITLNDQKQHSSLLLKSGCCRACK